MIRLLGKYKGYRRLFLNLILLIFIPWSIYQYALIPALSVISLDIAEARGLQAVSENSIGLDSLQNLLSEKEKVYSSLKVLQANTRTSRSESDFLEMIVQRADSADMAITELNIGDISAEEGLLSTTYNIRLKAKFPQVHKFIYLLESSGSVFQLHSFRWVSDYKRSLEGEMKLKYFLPINESGDEANDEAGGKDE